MAEEIKILTPIGMLGYSFREDLFWEAVEDGVDAIILDSGSTDGGPSKLAFGGTSVSRLAYERDLKILVAAAHYHHVPVLIGSAGGAGTNAHVALLSEIVQNIVAEEGYRPMKLVTIESEIAKEVIREKHAGGLVTPCSRAVPELGRADIEDAPVIVAQAGYEAWVEAMRAHPDFDLIIAGRSYDPAPYAAFCVHRGFPDLGLAHHMGKIMECGAVCALPKSAEALATVRRGSFDIRPLSPDARCTRISVAAHTLYEKTRPDLLAGPGGLLDVTDATYEELADGRTVRARGARFVPAREGEYTIKLEGARPKGYLAVVVGGMRDPILIAQLDELLPFVRAKLHEVLRFDLDVRFHVYGKHGPADDGAATQAAGSGQTEEVGVLAKVLASTQEKAAAAANLAKVFLIHAPYPGQMATAGNFMMPFAPPEAVIGPVAEFCVYHLMTVADATEHFPVRATTVAGTTNGHPGKDEAGSVNKRRQDSTASSLRGLANNVAADYLQSFRQTRPKLSPPPPEGTLYLASIATIIRSKNAGPYEVTLDVTFSDRDSYQRVRDANVLTRETIVRLYGITDPNHVLACLWWEPALAFKATIKRPVVSGSFDDLDVHGSGYHVPLMYLTVPDGKDRCVSGVAF